MGLETDTYQQLLKDSILDEQNFVSATFSGRQRGQAARWERVVIRPVEIKNKRHLQFSYFADNRDISKNYAGAEAGGHLDEVLAEGFRNFAVSTTGETIQINLSKKGKPFVNRQPVAAPAAVELAHNREKKKILADGKPERYLQAVGIMAEDGHVKASMHSKFKQINEFLRLLAETGALNTSHHAPMEVVDLGCGNAYLTFATYHYLHDVLGVPTNMVGVDVRGDLLAKHARHAEELGWTGLRFAESRIDAYHAPVPPDVVIALHACDTATDDAIALGVRANSRLIVCAPCCHHDLQAQLRKQAPPAPFGPVMSYGLFHERMGDILTDSFRALILRILGYRVDIVEFVSPEDSPKNLLIRAVKAGEPGATRHIDEYLALKQYWNVDPYLHQLLRAELDVLIGTATPA